MDTREIPKLPSPSENKNKNPKIMVAMMLQEIVSHIGTEGDSNEKREEIK
jgi:hypothetical protein